MGIFSSGRRHAFRHSLRGERGDQREKLERAIGHRFSCLGCSKFWFGGHRTAACRASDESDDLRRRAPVSARAVFFSQLHLHVRPQNLPVTRRLTYYFIAHAKEIVLEFNSVQVRSYRLSTVYTLATEVCRGIQL